MQKRHKARRKLSPVLFAMHVNDINVALNDHSDHKINILLYAGDLVIVANTKLDLQRKLDRLHQYCIKKCLSVNIKKSKILVINSRKPTGSFRFSTDTLEEVDSFKYLGVTFCRNGSFLQAQENLASQARRTQASLDCHIMQHKHLPNVIFELCDTLIKPILLHGSEIYGSSMSKDIEQVHANFIKKIVLAVKPSKNNCFIYIYVETGRYALQIDVHVRMIKYWLNLTLSHRHQYIWTYMQHVYHMQYIWTYVIIIYIIV